MFLEIQTLSRKLPISLNSDPDSGEDLTSSSMSALSPITNGQLRSPGQLGGTVVLQDTFHASGSAQSPIPSPLIQCLRLHGKLLGTES